MGFLDSSSGLTECILTRRGRELLAKNDGSFRITKFAFGDDEINYQLYNLSTDDDSDILNLPILEPSSNEDAALRYRLLTLQKGTVTVATLTLTPNFITLAPRTTGTIGRGVTTRAVVTVETGGGIDNSYTVISRNTNIVTANAGIASTTDTMNGSFATIICESTANITGQTTVDIIGNDTGAMATLVVSVSVVAAQ